MRLHFHSNFHCCVIIHYMNISSIIRMTSDELFPIGAIANSILLPNIHTYGFFKICNSFILGIDLQVESLRHSISIYWGTYAHCQVSNACQFTFHFNASSMQESWSYSRWSLIIPIYLLKNNLAVWHMYSGI